MTVATLHATSLRNNNFDNQYIILYFNNLPAFTEMVSYAWPLIHIIIEIGIVLPEDRLVVLT
jgi:hypothetical protein